MSEKEPLAVGDGVTFTLGGKVYKAVVSEVGDSCLKVEGLNGAWAGIQRKDVLKIHKPPHKPTLAERRERYEKRHKLPPLGEAKCDECDALAYTRWYEGNSVKPAMTICKPCEDEWMEDSRKNREALGLS